MWKEKHGTGGSMSPKIVYGNPVCKECGTKVFKLTEKGRCKCVLCGRETKRGEEGQS